MQHKVNRKFDPDILEKISGGDEKSFELLYKALFNELCRYAYRYLNDENSAYEIVQDIFVKLWEKRTETKGIKSVNSYLYRSVYNAIINYFDHQKVIRRHEVFAIVELRKFELGDFEDTFYGWDNYDKLHEFIDQLPEKNKKVFKLRYFENYSYKEISKRLNITDRTVETHIRNSLKDLRGKFKSFLEKQYLF